MGIRLRLALIATISMSLGVVPGGVIVWSVARTELLSDVSRRVQDETRAMASLHDARLVEVAGTLPLLATRLQDELARPLSAAEISEAAGSIEREADGAFRTPRIGAKQEVTTGVFLPPDAVLDDARLQFVARVRRVFDDVGVSTNELFRNVWLLTRDRAEIIFDRSFPNLAQYS